MSRPLIWRRRLAAAFVCPLALCLGLATAASAHTPSPSPSSVPGYAALGDSVASGTGAGPGSGDCRRSPGAYPVLWAGSHRPAQFAFAACSGAKIPDVTARQLPAVPPDTTLVSITVGANDVGFVDVLTTCVLGGEDACLTGIARAEQVMDRDLPGAYQQLYRAVGARTAPGARVVVTGYPHLYADRACLTGGLTQREVTALNAAVDHLDRVIEDQTRTHRDVVFADVRPRFAGHGLCSSDPWIHPPSLLALSVSFHPTAEGQRHGYLPAFASAAAGHRFPQ
ncbi:lipase 1 [Streptomyces mashuensis]|uniref:Lipase 1 n=1 Tax=Streptomyces mashuensis TaxID=33904 RepID=A0A919B5N5_9ACTN|nr:SGNH/GDSL hydrolase family protein [Streptomyces mashuensis]GHF53293.1 lipase 1 [Streptomyces mashuensis]